MTRIKTGGGLFDPAEEHAYFLAASADRIHHSSDHFNHLLIAVNSLSSDKDHERLDGWIAKGKKVFLDSGVFNLTTTHANKRGLTMDTVLKLPPQEVDGFEDLMLKYKKLLQRLEKKLWGYVEIDIGGRDNKIKTRTALEAEGFHPIPVYHPLLDGWDYFDELCQRYDRICFGNMVFSSRDICRKLISTLWERKRRYPDVWVHLLGFTPNELLYAMPVNSGDSSQWLSMLAWGHGEDRAMGQPFAKLDRDLLYNEKSDPASPTGHIKSAQMCAVNSYFALQNWKGYLKSCKQAGIDVYATYEESKP